MNDLDRSDLDLLTPLGQVAAPDQETMLAIATRFTADAADDSRPAPRRGAGRPTVRRLAIGGGAVAAAAAVIATVTLVSGSIAGNAAHDTDAEGQGGGQGGVRLILAALDTNADLIMHERTEITGPGQQPFISDDWFSALDPKPGQQVVQSGMITMGTRVDQRFAMIYAQPAAGAPVPASCGVSGATSNDPANAQVLVGNGESIDVEYSTRTWSDVTGGCLELSGADGPAQVRAQLAEGDWQQVPGQQIVDGKQATEFTHQYEADPGELAFTGSIWVDAQTYLPIKGLMVPKPGSPNAAAQQTITTTYSYEPGTPANLAALKPTIPPGFTRTAGH